MELPPNARSRAQKAAEARRAARHGMTPGSPSPARSTPPAHDGLPTLTLAEAAARQVELPALPGRPDQTLRHGGALLFRRPPEAGAGIARPRPPRRRHPPPQRCARPAPPRRGQSGRSASAERPRRQSAGEAPCGARPARCRHFPAGATAPKWCHGDGWGESSRGAKPACGRDRRLRLCGLQNGRLGGPHRSPQLPERSESRKIIKS